MVLTQHAIPALPSRNKNVKDILSKWRPGYKKNQKLVLKG